MRPSILLLGLCTSIASAVPFSVKERDVPLSLENSVQDPVTADYDWTVGYVSSYTIHASCNATQRHELSKGLEEAVALAKHAKEHILVHGNKSPLFQKYFGAGGVGAVIGWFDKIATFNRAGVLFRCDDPDKNCATQDNWAGHHRGDNASSETVICDRSYLTRLPLAALCARGFDVATGRPADYWGLDLIHRLYHVDLVGENLVDHHADGYHGVIELAAGENFTLAATNSATLSYFAAEVYAYDISIPGEGCLGKPVEGEEHSNHGGVSTSNIETSTVAATATTGIPETRVIPAITTTAEVVPTETSSQECHSHSDGTIHCV